MNNDQVNEGTNLISLRAGANLVGGELPAGRL